MDTTTEQRAHNAQDRRSRVRVVRVIDETDDAKSFVLEVTDARPSLFDYRPGQFLTFRVPSDRTGSVARCYSLASSPVCDRELKVTVKRTTSGYASNWLCDNLSVGDVIDVMAPAGTFTPRSLDEDLLLWAGGSGITPLLSILKTVLAAGSGHVALVYANRAAGSVIFADELHRLAAEHPDRVRVIGWLESEHGRPSTDDLARIVAAYPGRESFLCGPPGFMTTVREALSRFDVPRSHIHAEVFTSLSGDPFAEVNEVRQPGSEAEAVRVHIDHDGVTHTLDWPRERTLVDVLLAQGLDIPYSCREGRCGTCAFVVVEGEVEMDDNGVLDDEDIAEGYALACRARPRTAVVGARF
ncbi:MAG TPA: 3-ketosteroid-9-alpha-hydroxylase [Gordonia polyisoprenivorans]|uniref:ferredoxin--NADP reductase n=1 Tax=Gordonia polyisoprenivorans TaxID=84595 RepID=UPI000374DFB1|nr:ferredoxin--NADP reductase [Gordonia polyisoprenivorans]OZC32085.1 3-ketosteroid-9-alpha-hydroxylase [Gordonia polyisoprenivorans]HCS56375.1 3-ketosteroid-9-alpha-hydroxylase [Gordonia polyisoprenivorans]